MILLVDIVVPKKVLHLRDEYKHFSLGLLYVGSALEKSGREVSIVHISGDGDERDLKELVNKKPLFIGFSVLTGYFTEYAIHLSRKIKELDRNVTIVWGGIHPSLTPLQCLSESCIDVVCVGEGEYTIVELAQALEEGNDLKEVKGIAYRENGIPRLNELPPLIANLDDINVNLSLVDSESLISTIGNGQESIKVFGTITSRGCPFACTFCYNNMFNRRRWRANSPDYVVSQVLEMKKRHGINGVHFHDDNFFVDMKRAYTILEKLKKEGVVCHSVDMRIDSVTEESAKRLRELEVKVLYIGMDSGNERVLKLLDTKKPDIETKVEKLRILSEHSIRVMASFIIGLPTETWDEIMDTVNLAIRISREAPLVAFVFYTYVPWPGSELYKLAVKEGFKPPSSVEGWSRLDWDFFKDHWSPNFSKKDPYDMRMIIKYVQTLHNERSDEGGLMPWIKTRVTNFFYALTCYRLSHRNFFLPMDLHAYRFLRQAHKRLAERAG